LFPRGHIPKMAAEFVICPKAFPIRAELAVATRPKLAVATRQWGAARLPASPDCAQVGLARRKRLLTRGLRISVFAGPLFSQDPSLVTTYSEWAEPVRNPG